MTDTNLGAMALELCCDGKDAPEIARILTAELPAGSKPLTSDDARELYQSEFRKTRAEKWGNR